MTGGGAFFEQFIEDYHSECDEHLAASRRVLIELEGGAGGRAPEARLLRDLFRSLHTLKGLSGMVGDACAERLAHALEESLRAAERAAAPLPPAFLDGLFAGVELLERCITARQAGLASPDVDATLDGLARTAAALAGGGEGARPAPSVAPADVGAAHAGAVVYRFEFEPSVALASRGIGVDAVRGRLQATGTILAAGPRMTASGVAFDFRVAVPPGRAPDDAWSADGLRWWVEDAVPSSAGESAGEGAAGDADAAEAASRAPAGAPAGTTQGTTQGTTSVRVDLARLDGVMRLVGDLVTSRSRLDELLRRAAAGELQAVRDALEETNSVMERQLRRLRESVTRIRLVPIGEVFERLRFAARDAIRESGKQVTLSLHGQSTEIDKLVVDRMLEPLLHLVRNAVSHGIEPPAERMARGKPADGRLALRAAASGDRILVEVEDDGAGIDVQRVAARARTLGLLEPAEPLTTERLLDVLCAPGFSVRDEADRTSGRGIGMDVVRSTVRALGGELALDTATGRGTRFVIELPLTLMIVDALLVGIGDREMAVPQPALDEILQVEAASVVRFEGNEVVPYRDGVLPLVDLARLLGSVAPRPASFYVLVVGTHATPRGLPVDRLLGLREIVVHPVTDPLVAVPGVAGATELGDGRVSLILDVAAVLRLAQEDMARRERRGPRHAAAGTPSGG